jgi:hypothetical protein
MFHSPLCRDDEEDYETSGGEHQFLLFSDDAENDERVLQGSRRTTRI